MLTHFISMEKKVKITFQNSFHNVESFYFYGEKSEN